jgi:hypothetical protein
MPKPLLWTLLSAGLALLPLQAPASDAAAMNAATGLQIFELRFESADREGLITPARAATLRQRLDALKSLYGLDQAPDGDALSAQQGQSLRADLDALSHRLFRT